MPDAQKIVIVGGVACGCQQRFRAELGARHIEPLGHFFDRLQRRFDSSQSASGLASGSIAITLTFGVMRGSTWSAS